MDHTRHAVEMHEKWRGKIEIVPRVPLDTSEALAVAYTPGVAQPCLAIHKDNDLSYTLTRRGNMVAVVTDGSAVLGLGDIGPEAGMPVMEGKCCLFKAFGDVDAFPLCIRSNDVDEIVRTVYLLSGSFGGINLEDIAAPRCFEIEQKLQNLCDIPVFHDDQHGTAIAVTAALINALRIVHKQLGDTRIVISGAGAAGIATAKLLLRMGARNLLLTGRHGIIAEDSAKINRVQAEMGRITNPGRIHGALADAMLRADVFIGVSAPGIVTKEMVASMANNAIVMAMANPVPEIFPDDAKAGGARIVGTGRSDFPNQINNVLVFPGIFRGALDVRAGRINDEMKIAAAHAIAALVPDHKLSETYIVPEATDKRVGPAVSAAVSIAARESGVARITA